MSLVLDHQNTTIQSFSIHVNPRTRKMTISSPSAITVHQFEVSADSEIDFGAELRNVDLSNVTTDDFEIIRNAVYNYQVVLIKDQSAVTPAQQFALNNLFDPAGTKAYVGDAPEIAQFRVDGTTGSLTSNGITLTPGDALWGGVDPSGRFLFTANVDGTVSQFIIGSTGALIPNGSAYLGVNMAGETLAFAQQ